MNPIKQNREKLGLTQQMLAEKTQLSLRTIQRVEAKPDAPKGHTLQKLAETFDLSIGALQQQFDQDPISTETVQEALRLINLSTLIFYILPLGNLILPILVWRKRRALSKQINESGRRIINFQYLWIIAFGGLLSISPFLSAALNLPKSLILWILLIGVAVHLTVFFRTALAIQKGQFDFLALPIRLF